MEKLKHTPGPWYWNINRQNHTIRLETRGMGSEWHEFVMDFVRWGMGRAMPRFRSGHIMVPSKELAENIPGHDHHADFFQTINHPDALLIASAPELLAQLIHTHEVQCIDKKYIESHHYKQNLAAIRKAHPDY